MSEIPSNVLLQIVGPQRWLSAQLFAWGFVATFQAFITTYPAYLVTRLLLGLLEGGFIPGMEFSTVFASLELTIQAPCTICLNGTKKERPAFAPVYSFSVRCLHRQLQI